MSDTEFRAYAFKTSTQAELRTGLDRLLGLSKEAGQQLLNSLWSEDWIQRLGKSKGIAYKSIGEDNVGLVKEGIVLYLPSRIRRGIAEQVGRTLRSQYERLQCFEDVKTIVLDIGLEGRLHELTRQVDWTLQCLYGKHYEWILIHQTLQLLRRWYFKYGMDIGMLIYTEIVQPVLRNALLPYAGDDGPQEGQAIQYGVTATKIHYKIKVPVTSIPVSKKDWQWLEESLSIPKKICKRIKTAESKLPHQPELRLFTLKGGIQLPVLQFSWEYAQAQLTVSTPKKDRVLAVDTGMVNLTTSVVCQAGSQITPPIFYKRARSEARKIETLYQIISKLQAKLKRYPANWRGQTRRSIELQRLYAKLNHIRKEISYAVVKELLRQAGTQHCTTIVLENLKSYSPPKGRHELSRRLNNWLRGRIVTLLQHKTVLLGIHVKLVPAYWTSSYCPRCGLKGQKVDTTTATKENATGRCFYCPHCEFRADRDYVGALNVYRVFLVPKKQRSNITLAKPIFYTKIGLPVHRSAGKTVSPRPAGAPAGLQEQ